MKATLKTISILAGLSVLIPLLILTLSAWESGGLEGKGLYVSVLGLGFIVQLIVYCSWLILSLISKNNKKMTRALIIAGSFLPLAYMLFLNNQAYIAAYLASLLVTGIGIFFEFKN